MMTRRRDVRRWNAALSCQMTKCSTKFNYDESSLAPEYTVEVTGPHRTHRRIIQGPTQQFLLGTIRRPETDAASIWI